MCVCGVHSQLSTTNANMRSPNRRIGFVWVYLIEHDCCSHSPALPRNRLYVRHNGCACRIEQWAHIHNTCLWMPNIWPFTAHICSEYECESMYCCVWLHYIFINSTQLTPTQTELLRVKTNASQQQIQLFAFCLPHPEICSVRPSANLSLGDGWYISWPFEVVVYRSQAESSVSIVIRVLRDL